MADPGVRLQLFAGKTVVRPAPYEVVDALESVEVENRDRERDTFQLTFAVGKDSKDALVDYRLLGSGILDPPARVSIVVFLRDGPEVLINGMVVNHQLVPAYRPGESTLIVTGEDLSCDMDQKEPSGAAFKNQTDSAIVTDIVKRYGLEPEVTQTRESRTEDRGQRSQQETDLKYVQRLAGRNGFVFFVEPTAKTGRSRAHWGPERRSGRKQPTISVSMGPDSNVDRPVTFTFDAMGPVQPRASILDPLTGLTIEIPAPASLLAGLSGRPAKPLRTTVARDAAKLDSVRAALRLLAASAGSGDAVTVHGELDAVRYGRALRSRALVGVAGAGSSYGGTYYVQQVTHHIRRGSYTQSYRLTRDGLGAAP
jgi:hypothetical protein